MSPKTQQTATRERTQEHEAQVVPAPPDRGPGRITIPKDPESEDITYHVMVDAYLAAGLHGIAVRDDNGGDIMVFELWDDLLHWFYKEQIPCAWIHTQRSSWLMMPYMQTGEEVEE